nr:immunoglobulin light chain junction region [Macaca mulatta]MOV77717.1 immunoglobulin light chain junction region [Macaca mulatta]MOV77732.1 immunoglobulin light chain junction region [Macaca mulatta]MOV78015.1 immunoglobulin light chain junction region [Macaca mulatta]MOV78112.1 immunoglobulin light chain junction region [Macaca mulatta]
CLQGDTAPFTF